MQKITLWAALLLMLIGILSACNQTTVDEPSPTLMPEATVPAVTEEPTEEPAMDPTAETEAPTSEPTAEPVDTPNEEPVAEPTESPATDQPESGEVATFTLADGVGSTVSTEYLPAATGDAQQPYWSILPEHVTYTVTDYPITDSNFPAEIIIFPADAAGSVNVGMADQISQLEQLLAERPSEWPESLPFMPLQNAVQMIVAQPTYLDFENGSGVRYLTTYSQAVAPLINESLIYTFQGFTNDGSQLVTAVFPINTDILPDRSVFEEIDFDAFAADYDSYLADIAAELDALPADAFTPSLDPLDATIASLYVEPLPAPVAGDALTIILPVENGQALVESELSVTGTTPIGSAESVSVMLMAGGNMLASAEAPVDANGLWATTVTVPANVIGQASVEAATAEETITVPVSLVSNFNQLSVEDEISLNLFRPISGETAVAGYPVYFSGTVENPIDDTITVGVLTDNCSRFLARQSFSVSGGDWTGVVVLPADVTDPDACAVVYTGTYGEGDWRERQVSLPILSADDPNVFRIALADGFGYEWQAGTSPRVAGMAVDAPEVLVELVDPASEEVISEATATVGEFGLWETFLPIPEDAPSFVIVNFTLVEEDVEEPYWLSTGATITP